MGPVRFRPIMRPGVDPASAPNKPPLPPLAYDLRHEHGLKIERNVAIPLRDGTRIYADLYRPEGAAGEADLPLLLAWGPYGKHALSNQVFWPRSGVNPEWLSPLTPFEGPDPVHWCPRGYAVAVVDPRGAWQSEGDFHHNGLEEAEDCFDAIGWLAAQPWSNGKVGMTGASAMGITSNLAAMSGAPHLTAAYVTVSHGSSYNYSGYPGGIFLKNLLDQLFCLGN